MLKGSRLFTLIVAGLLFSTATVWANDEQMAWQNLPAWKSNSAWKALGALPIQSQGRVKPLDSFARETVHSLTKRSAFENQHPVETVLAIVTYPGDWSEAPVLLVPYRPLREALGLGPEARSISYAKLMSDKKLMPMLPAVAQKQRRSESLNRMEQEVNDLYLRMLTFHRLMTADAFRVIPPLETSATQEWVSPLAAEGYSPQAQVAIREAWMNFVEVLGQGESGVDQVLTELKRVRNASGVATLPAPWRLDLEVRYNQLRPFHLSWIGYLIASILLMIGFKGNKPVQKFGIYLLWGVFILHVGGLVTRVILSGRAPVSNLYESMLWLALVVVILGAVLQRMTQSDYALLASGWMAGITVMLADQLPFEPWLHPIIAVLRSNLWLTIHVLTIVASYGAIALATAVAHVAGVFYLLKRPPSLLAKLYQLLYRSIQIGVILLSAGIMLGALWANVSWGRYWGWDPKETWSLITLLWFLAVLHGRYAGWIKGIGLALATIGGFLLMLMTYYGVNFFLVGLHSYAGGSAAQPLPPLLIAYLTAEAIFVGLVWRAGSRGTS